MPDIREEFEAFAKKHHESDWRAHGIKLFALLPGSEEYDFAFIQSDWETWQASRAALRVELPDNSARAGSDPYQDGYYACREEVEEALQHAGIEVKP